MMQEIGIRYHHKYFHSSNELVIVCSLDSIADDVSEITSVCETSEVNVKAIYDQDQSYSYFQTTSLDKYVNHEPSSLVGLALCDSHISYKPIFDEDLDLHLMMTKCYH